MPEPSYTSTWNSGVTSSTPSSTPSYTGGGGGGQGVHWNEPIISELEEEIVPIVNNPPPVIDDPREAAIATNYAPPPTTVYEDVFEPYDMMPSEDETFQGQNVPSMTTGFGSVFGASSGSTGSSETVQDALTFMIDQNVQEIIDNQGYTTSSDINDAIDAAYENFYPQIDQMTLEEFVAEEGTEADYIASMAAMEPGHANLMGSIPPGQIHIGDQYYNDWLESTNIPGGGEYYDDWDGGGQGPAGMTLADLARHTWFSQSLADVEAREQARLEAGLGVATMANMEQMYGREFASKANPLFDPEFSLAATREFDPEDIYGDLRLWQEAQA